METTFVINREELDSNFLESLRKLFKHQKQLQISVSVPEDFNLLQAEKPDQYLARLEICLNDYNSGVNTLAFSESDLEDIIIEKL